MAAWCISQVHQVSLSIDKSLTLKAVARSGQLDLAGSFAFGDDVPDIEMFKVVGSSVAMENAKDAVKKEATYLTGHCDSDAIAFFLREFVL
ncbi:MAG: hydroxymethylpyrimidine pyrophosphatase-like HAD family hydrolase [Limisphaerales bacterium]|jgi:hydroxymethylpyrimidine pyrophosphatase-like HAD family hydrolase